MGVMPSGPSPARFPWGYHLDPQRCHCSPTGGRNCIHGLAGTAQASPGTLAAKGGLTSFMSEPKKKKKISLVLKTAVFVY
jgi:hypothetical protein